MFLLGCEKCQFKEVFNFLMDCTPLHWVVVLVELLDEVRVHDLSELFTVVHDCEVCLVLFSESAIQIVLVI